MKNELLENQSGTTSNTPRGWGRYAPFTRETFGQYFPWCGPASPEYVDIAAATVTAFEIPEYAAMLVYSSRSRSRANEVWGRWNVGAPGISASETGGFWIRHGLAALFAQISELACEQEADELGILRPTQYAIDTTVHILLAADLAAPIDFELSPGNVSSDYEGGIRIEWVHGKNAVHLAIGADSEKPSYIYREANRKYTVEHDVTDRALLQSLIDLNDASR